MLFPHAIRHPSCAAFTFLMLFAAGCGTARSDESAKKPPQEKHWPKAAVVSDELKRIIDAQTDILGEAALKQPGGPSYEFFADKLPPMRYVDAPFRHYPITLSAPGAPVKARFISNGSAINALARQRNWIGETGTPVTIRVGKDIALFGEDLSRLDGPKYEQGYLPIVQLSYRHGPHTYAQEVFAPVAPDLVKGGVVFARFTAAKGPSGDKGKVEAQIEGYTIHKVADGVVRDENGKVVACFEPNKWRYTPARGTLIADLAAGESAVLAIYTQAGDEPHAI